LTLNLPSVTKKASDQRTKKTKDVAVPSSATPGSTAVLNVPVQPVKSAAPDAPDLLAGQASIDLLGVLDTPPQPVHQMAHPKGANNNFDNLFSSTTSAAPGTAPQQAASTEVWNAFQSNEPSHPEFGDFQRPCMASPGWAGQGQGQVSAWHTQTQPPLTESLPHMNWSGNHQAMARPGSVTQDPFRQTSNMTFGMTAAGRGSSLTTTASPGRSSQSQQGVASYVPQVGALFGGNAFRDAPLSDVDALLSRTLDGVANMSFENRTAQSAGQKNSTKPMSLTPSGLR